MAMTLPNPVVNQTAHTADIKLVTSCGVPFVVRVSTKPAFDSPEEFVEEARASIKFLNAMRAGARQPVHE